MTTSNTILHAIVAANINAAIRYLKIFDKASAPTVGTDTPVANIPLTGGATGPLVQIVLDLELDNGLAYALVTGIALTNSTAVAASEQLVNLLYKAQ